jgi:succinate dehydrogenase/fumarate reductase flavoprotein subunit
MKKTYHTIVIGTGCAGYNAADWLYNLGVTDIAIITEGINMGTSRNTGSDKQTYYKLTLAGEEPDSVYGMARTLFDGGAVHGDTALIEAACSVKCFMKLVHLGLPFPTNPYGAYIGYKTDHDPRQRATSCGPLTSKLMTEALEKSVMQKKIPIHDKKRVLKILTADNTVTGVLAADTKTREYNIFACNNLILATGGPAAVYRDVVYPKSQTGALGLAINAGAVMQNLNEWQYGMSSVKFRWNVSGTYQQVLPRYIAVDSNGVEREFLPERFGSASKALDMVFLKGYQWPYDVRKTKGSSRVDLFVHDEITRGNKVFMDFINNPTGLENGFEVLSDEAKNYLLNSNAAFGTPIERLEKMNPRAIQLYLKNGINLYKEPLEIAVCAQHLNGGVKVDTHWETTVKGLYAVGEAAGTHGTYRPGGSALNAGQVGSMRAAEHISCKKMTDLRQIHFEIEDWKINNDFDAEAFIAHTQGEMSENASFRRDKRKMKLLLDEITCVLSRREISEFDPVFDTLTTQAAVLSAMLYAEENVSPEYAVVTKYFDSSREKIRPVPEGGGWFEAIYAESASG